MNPATLYSLQNRYFWLANVLIWLAVHVFFTHSQFVIKEGTEHARSWAEMWVYQAPWFFNFIWVTGLIFTINRFVFRAKCKLVCKVFAHLTAMILILLLYWTLSSIPHYYLFIEQITFTQFWMRVVFEYGHVEVLVYSGILALAVGAYMYHSMLDKKLELKQLQYALSQEQLKALRSQLNPHFLFNVLNSIASLVRLKREKEAISALSQLSFMLRTILENKNNEDIKIKDEIAFINSYLTIQKLRFTEKLDTNIDVSDDCLDVAIPNMLIQPLVENAVQHGSQLESNKNLIQLNIFRSPDAITFNLTNKVAQKEQKSGFGIGLTNTRERLTKLYEDFVLETKPIGNDLFETHLVLPIGEEHAKRLDS